MKPKDHRLRVGLVLSMFVALLFTLVFSLDGALAWLEGAQKVEVVFEEVHGLRPSDPVHFHGIPCGRVLDIRVCGCDEVLAPGVAFAQEIELEERVDGDDCSRIVLTLEVPDEYFEHLRKGSLAKINKTLTGVTVVDLRQGSGPPLEPGDLLSGVPTVTFAAVATRMHGGVGRMEAILGEIEPMVASIREEALLQNVLRRLDGATTEAELLAGSLRNVVDENREPLRNIANRVDDLLVSIDGSVPELIDALAEGRVAAHRLGDLAGQLGEWVQEHRPSLSSTAEDLEVTAGNFKTLSTELRRRPWRLLHQPDRQEVEEIGLFELANAYALGSVEVRRSAEAIALMLENPAGGATEEGLRSALEELEVRLSKHEDFQSRFWRELDRLYPPKE